MISLNSHLATLSNKYGYEIYLEENLELEKTEPKVRFRIDSESDTFHLKFSRSWNVYEGNNRSQIFQVIDLILKENLNFWMHSDVVL